MCIILIAAGIGLFALGVNTILVYQQLNGLESRLNELEKIIYTEDKEYDG
jgi:hypothetical protein